MTKEPAYYRGYPARLRSAWRAQRVFTFVFFTPFALLAGAATILYGYVLLMAGGMAAGIGCAVSLGFVLYFSWVMRDHLSDSVTGRIVPYFSEHVGETDTFGGGFALAANCETLDAIAVENSIAPLSQFGFADDLSNETLVWHSAERGHSAFCQLKEFLDRTDHDVTDRAGVIRDLEAIEAALKRAAARSIQFSLILRCGADHAVSPVEMDRRAGSFW